MTASYPGERPNNLSLEFVGRLLEADIRNIWYYGTFVVCRSLFLWIFAVIVVVVALLGTLAALLDERFRTVPFITAVCVLLTMIAAPFADYRFAIRRYRKRADEYLETRVTLTPARVAIENDSFRTEFGWKLIGVVADTPQGMLFCNQHFLTLFWLPERVLTGEHGRNELRTLLAQTKVRVLTF